MENQSFKEEEKNAVENSAVNNNQLEWGAHNPKLTADNFIDGPRKNSADRDQILVNKNEATD